MAISGPRTIESAATRAPTTLAALRRAARRCRACDLWKAATQTVFGAGPVGARVMLIGEHAGDREDRTGEPFVGPAGRLLDAALADAGIDRADLYVTNVIKHFKFELRGKRRLHTRANAAEIDACQRWLDAELQLVRPERIVCLGAMAAKVVFGASFKLQQQRGRGIVLEGGRRALATVHPSFVIRSRIGGGYDEAYAGLVADLRRLHDDATD